MAARIGFNQSLHGRCELSLVPILGRCFVGLPRITARGRPRMFFSKRNTYIFVFFSGIPYHLHITTGDVRNASTNAKVYVILHGGEGEDNSGKLWLQNDKKDNFQRGRTDIFIVETTKMLSPLHHLTVGHDNSGLGAGWYCEKVKLAGEKEKQKKESSSQAIF